MSQILPTLGRLTDVPVRDAWIHEAGVFTPWLAENLDRLGDELGFPLEIVGMEMAVQTFSADILARDATGDRLVLIENQLECSDHTHLGQIMTYLAGLEASVVVWVATSFREPHLSAIRWLNQHTVDPFAFFAVQVRVVRIGDSQMAPLFDILEKPNGWERQIQKKAREASTPSTELSQLRLEFWTRYLTRYPAKNGWEGRPYALPARSRQDFPFGLSLMQHISKDSVGVYVRGARGSKVENVRPILEPYRDVLEERLGQVFGGGSNGNFFWGHLKIDSYDRANWDRAADWLDSTTARYEAILREVLAEALPPALETM